MHISLEGKSVSIFLTLVFFFFYQIISVLCKTILIVKLNNSKLCFLLLLFIPTSTDHGYECTLNFCGCTCSCISYVEYITKNEINIGVK